MADYTPSVPNSFDSNLIPFKLRQDYLKEYIGSTPLTAFMGTAASKAIQLFEIQNGQGLSYRVPFRKELDYSKPVKGFAQAAGTEQPITFFYDEIKLDLLRFTDMLMGVPLVKQMTPVDVYNSLRPALLTAQKRNLIQSLLEAATINLYSTTATATVGPVADRVIYAGVSAATDTSTIYKGCNAMTGVTYDTNGLSVAHIRRLKSMAVIGGVSFENESRIMPVELKTKNNFPEEYYILLIDNESLRSLEKDPDWREYSYRGVIQNSDQPEGISGSRYRGMVEGVMIYECPELAEHRVKASGNKIAAWNLFLGAQALGLCWAQRPYFEMEERDFKLNVAMAVCEIRGQKALTFPSFANPTKQVERGLIHSFTMIKS